MKSNEELLKELNNTLPENSREPEPFDIKKEIFSWTYTIVICFIIAFFINRFIIINANVPTGSMESTIMTGDRVIATRYSYWFSSPKRGDIVVFEYPDDPSQYYVKRVAGLPGDTVEILDGIVYINGEVLDEPYLKETPYGDYGPYSVPEDSYFMLGDNRNYSEDSRYWDNTYVSEDAILAKVMFRYWPSIGLID